LRRESLRWFVGRALIQSQFGLQVVEERLNFSLFFGFWRFLFGFPVVELLDLLL
jgi:hypothetical protein